MGRGRHGRDGAAGSCVVVVSAVDPNGRAASRGGKLSRMRHRPEPSDLAASLVPRVGDVPFAPRAAVRDGRPLLVLPPEMRRRPSPAREAADAAEQQAIADAVEGVLP